MAIWVKTEKRTSQKVILQKPHFVSFVGYLVLSKHTTV
jgi:hypothetical protein